MKLYKITSAEKNPEDILLICGELIIAQSFIDKLFGLVFKTLKPGQGFVIRDCSSIHTFWMRYKIDVVFLNEKNEIIKLYESFRQSRITPVISKANCVIEFPETTINNYRLKTGDMLKII
ncbi:MAG: DUF192 domain-containing protein [Candidatus Humimicrobiaceae bacterium]